MSGERQLLNGGITMNENFSSLPQEDRPYERCIRHGVQSLSNRDLLAVILRTGAKGRNVLELAGDLLKLYGNSKTES